MSYQENISHFPYKQALIQEIFSSILNVSRMGNGKCVKMIEENKSQEIKADNLLKSIDFSPFELVSMQPYNSPSPINALFAINPITITLKWKEPGYDQQRRFNFIVEPRIISGQKALPDAVLRIRSLQTPGFSAMIIASHLNSRELNVLKEEQISAFDQSGNCVVVSPQQQLFILKTGQQNKNPERRTTKNVYAGITSLVARALLLRKQFASGIDIQKEIEKRGAKIALSTVAKALGGLKRDYIITKDRPVSVTQPKRLLELLRENYRKPEPLRRVTGRIESPDPQGILRKISTEATKNDVLMAIDSPSQYTILPANNDVTRIYVSSVDKLLSTNSNLRFKEDSRFSNVEFLEVDDQTVFFDSRSEYASPIQVYLELATSGKREREAAEQMVDDIINYRYGNN